MSVLDKKDKNINISKSQKKVKNLTTKKSILALGLLIIGISLIPPAFLISSNTIELDEKDLVEENFSKILLNVKRNLEFEFNILLEDMKNDPLDGLFLDLMPSAEEIFYFEWANDEFPEIAIPLIGEMIQALGSERIGNINLDDQPPEADLNISSINHPSELIMSQCKALWDPLNKLSLVNEIPLNWFDLVEGKLDDQNILMSNFNLTERQINLIAQWINVSKNGWMIEFVQSETISLNYFTLFGLISAGVISVTIAILLLRSELKRKNAQISKKLMN